MECAGKKARNWTGSRHVPIRRPSLVRLPSSHFSSGATLALAQQAPLVGIEPIRASLDQIETQTRRSTAPCARADRAGAAHLAAARRPARQARRSRAAPRRRRCAAEGARRRARAAPQPKTPTIAAERARLTRAARRARCRDQAGAAAADARRRSSPQRSSTGAARPTRRRCSAGRRMCSIRISGATWSMALPDYGERLAQFAQDWIALRASRAARRGSRRRRSRLPGC